MGSGFSKMKKQARLMEQQYEKMREDAKNTQVAGSSGNGLVTVTVNGDKEIQSIAIKPECVDPSDWKGSKISSKQLAKTPTAKSMRNPLSRAGCRSASKKFKLKREPCGSLSFFLICLSSF